MSNHTLSGEKVLKHRLSSRLFHWALIISFLPAAATGLVIYLKFGGEDFVNIAMRIHIVSAAILTLSSVLYTLFSFDRVVAFLRLIFTFGKDDMEWMQVGGGYPQKMILNKEISVPPMDKMNSGQKMLGVSVLFGTIFLIFTGWMLYMFIPFIPKIFSLYAHYVHWGLGLMLTAFIMGHIFLGIYNWEDFKTMFGDGTQPLEVAKHHNPLWVFNKIEQCADKNASEKE